MSASEWLNTSASVFSALGTVGAFAVGGVVLWRDRKATAQQRHEEQARAETDRRKQASSVTGWAVSTDSDHYSSGRFVVGGEPEPIRIQYNVLNGSEGPIADVVVYVPNEEGAPRTNLAFGFMLPGVKTSKERPDTSDRRSSDFYVPQPIPIFFTDTQGIRWLRDGLGALYEWSDEVDARLVEPWAVVAAEGTPPELTQGPPGRAPEPPAPA
ncbi:hypothetical protein ACH4KO_00570 [Streptomyces anulatus]